MRDETLDAMTQDERIAWIDSLDPASVESRVLHCPEGWRSTLALVSYTKRLLVKVPMTADLRLRFLVVIDKLMDLTTGMSRGIATVAPADDVGAEIIRAAMSLPDRGGFAVLRRFDVFSSLARANPTLLAALDCCGPGRGRAR